MCAHLTRMLAIHRDTHAHSTHAHTHAHGCVIRCTRNGGYKPHILILISKYRTFHPRFSEGSFVIMCASHSGHFRTEGLVSYTRMREKAEESDLWAPSRGWRRGREPRVGLRGPGAVALHCPPQTTPLRVVLLPSRRWTTSEKTPVTQSHARSRCRQEEGRSRERRVSRGVAQARRLSGLLVSVRLWRPGAIANSGP